MAMIQCPECGKDISTDAKSCPHCGCLVRKRLQQQERKKNRTEKEKIREAAAKPSGGKPGNKKIPILAAVAAVVVAAVLLVVLVVLPNARIKAPAPYRTVGSIVTFGHYEQDADESNGPEPIEWIVLDVQGGKALLLSKYGLDVKPYNTELADVTWETCTLRSWLNGDFLNAAFSEKERSAILLTEVDNSDTQGFDWVAAGWSEINPTGGNNTQDKIFLLSWAEAEKYLEMAVHDYDNPDKVYPKAQAAPTEYAVRNGAVAYKTAEGDAAWWWWLRSPGSMQLIAANVSSDGSLSDNGVGNGAVCVRPAFWLNLESDIF